MSNMIHDPTSQVVEGAARSLGLDAQVAAISCRLLKRRFQLGICCHGTFSKSLGLKQQIYLIHLDT